MEDGKLTPKLVAKAFMLLSEEDKLRCLRQISGELSGLSPQMRVELLDLARDKATEIAAKECAVGKMFQDKLEARNRKADEETVRLADAIRILRDGRLSWKETVTTLWDDHPELLGEEPGQPLTEERYQQKLNLCRTVHRRIVLKKKDAPRKRPKRKRATPPVRTSSDNS